MSLKNRKRKELDLEIGKGKKEKNGSTLGQEHKMDLAPVDPGLADLAPRPSPGGPRSSASPSGPRPSPGGPGLFFLFFLIFPIFSYFGGGCENRPISFLFSIPIFPIFPNFFLFFKLKIVKK